MMKPKKTLDPDVEAFIRALAQEDAKRDHFRELRGEPAPLDDDIPERHKNRLKVVIRVPDGCGGYKKISPSERFEASRELIRKAIEDIEAGRDDELGIGKALGKVGVKLNKGKRQNGRPDEVNHR